ncbi:MAG: hypothetical protein FVQ84_05935 [Planctomycetes bacterium]|nr:hypothetical protein [Planctomycetota bacterium]
MGVEVKGSYIKQFDISNSLHWFWINTSKEQLLDKLFIFIEVVVEYAFGTHIGYALGWVIGLYVGHSYVEHFEPVYLDDLSQLSYWRLAPYIFARNGAVIGVAIGIIAIALIHNKSHKECKSDEHTKHLCSFESYGYHVNNEADYKDIVKEPGYKCDFCGLTANLEESLCNPTKL